MEVMAWDVAEKIGRELCVAVFPKEFQATYHQKIREIAERRGRKAMDPTQVIGQLYIQLQTEHQAHMRTIAVMNAVVRHASGDRDDNAIDPARVTVDALSGRYTIADPEPPDDE